MVDSLASPPEGRIEAANLAANLAPAGAEAIHRFAKDTATTAAKTVLGGGDALRDIAKGSATTAAEAGIGAGKGLNEADATAGALMQLARALGISGPGGSGEAGADAAQSGIAPAPQEKTMDPDIAAEQGHAEGFLEGMGVLLQMLQQGDGSGAQAPQQQGGPATLPPVLEQLQRGLGGY